MKCPSAETLSDLLDNALPTAAGGAVKRHAQRCPACARQFAAEASLREQTIAFAAGATAPASLRVRVFAAVAKPPVPAFHRRSRMLLLPLCAALSQL